MSHFGFLLLGLGAGAAYAALAMALVVTYRSSGVINFASGSIAVYAAYIYAFLRRGEFLPMIPGLPKSVELPFTPGFVVALVWALAMTALLGLLLYVLVFRPLRTAPPLSRVVASIGIQIALVLLITKQMGTTQVPVKPIFPDSDFTLGNATVHTEQMWTALTVVAVALGLSALFRYTRFGLATRAAAESEKGAYVSRISANRVAALNWMLSSAVAGLAGVLIAPLIAVVPLVFSLFVVSSLAAAVVARFEALGPAVFAGLAIGMLESEARFLNSEWSWFPKNGGPELVSLVVILVALVVRGKPLPARGALIQRSLGRAPRPRNVWVTTVVAFGLGTLALFVLDNQWRTAFIISVVFGTLGLSFVVVTGYAGQISLAQLTLAGTAAYMLSYFSQSWDIPFPIAPVMAALVAMMIGVVVGLPALRVRGLSVAVVTLSLAVTVDAVWFRNTDIVGFSPVKVPSPELFGMDLSFGVSADATHLSFGMFALVVLTLCGVGVALLRRSPLGSSMVAVRANERSAAAAGVDVFRVKIAAFAIASFLAGVCGVMLAYRYETLSYQQFEPLLGLSIFATAYLAGITSVAGGVVAGMLVVTGLSYTATNEWLGETLGEQYQLITGVLLVVTVIFNPEGIVGPNHEIADKLHERRRAKRAARSGAPEAVEPPGRLTAAPIDVTGLPAVMSVRDLRVAYGGVVAVDRVSFDVPDGAIVGLIGPNGAGKTTMVDALSGFAPHTGTVTFEGRDLHGLKPHQRVKHGLSRTFQAIELYDDLAVEENLEVGFASGRQGHGHSAWERLDQTCAVLGLQDQRERPAADLSQGQRQLVSIGRALVGQPRLLLLDEPAAGLDTQESEWLGLRLRDVRAGGVTILMVDHDVNLVLNLCDYIVVLDFGQLIAQGTPSQIRADPKVIAAYLGSTHSGDDVPTPIEPLATERTHT